MRINIFLNFLLCALLGCQPEVLKESAIIDNQKKPFPVIINKISTDSIIGIDNGFNEPWESYTNFDYHYIGNLTDTIYAEPSIHISPLSLPEGFLSVQDTGTIIHSDHEMYLREYYEIHLAQNSNKATIDLRVDTTTRLYQGYPVLVQNLGSDTIYIGSTNGASLMMEAIDTTGKWRPIQKRYKSVCGTGIGMVVLPPQVCVLTSTPIFTGEFKTSLRVVYGDGGGDIYSQPFTGSIDYRLFETSK